MNKKQEQNLIDNSYYLPSPQYVPSSDNFSPTLTYTYVLPPEEKEQRQEEEQIQEEQQTQEEQHTRRRTGREIIYSAYIGI